jgi:hypothetical protein
MKKLTVLSNFLILIILLFFNLNNAQKNGTTNYNHETLNMNQSLQKLNSNKSNNSNVQLGLPVHTIAITLTMYSFIFFIGFFGNALVIFVVCRNKSLQHNTNYCLVNLSVADLLLIIVCMPSAIMDLFSKEVWYFGYFMCKI